MRPLGITASQFTLLTQLAQQDGITAVEIGCTLDIEKSTLSRNLKRLLALGLFSGGNGAPGHAVAIGCKPALAKESWPVGSDTPGGGIPREAQ